MAEYAGRCVALCVMALYAREDAVANGNQAFHALSVSSDRTGSSGLPWADEVSTCSTRSPSSGCPTT
jgi:hypothetical protein